MRAAALALIPTAIGVQVYRRRKTLAADAAAPAPVAPAEELPPVAPAGELP
jgi:putative oxidoreductase